MNVVFTPRADQEILSAIDYYNEKQTGLGDRFNYELQISIGYIAIWPEKSSKRYKNARAVLINKFPFLIFYTYHSKEQSIFILSVFNTYQNPKKIKRRLYK